MLVTAAGVGGGCGGAGDKAQVQERQFFNPDCSVLQSVACDKSYVFPDLPVACVLQNHEFMQC